jgi:hypothetical protein
MEFKKLELSTQENWFRRTFLSKHAKKTLLYIAIGATASFLYFYFTEGKNLDVITAGDVFNSTLIGSFFGFFLTNSPCARGRC